jgi:hypothetical protein
VHMCVRAEQWVVYDRWLVAYERFSCWLEPNTNLFSYRVSLYSRVMW